MLETKQTNCPCASSLSLSLFLDFLMRGRPPFSKASCRDDGVSPVHSSRTRFAFALQTGKTPIELGREFTSFFLL